MAHALPIVRKRAKVTFPGPAEKRESPVFWRHEPGLASPGLSPLPAASRRGSGAGEEIPSMGPLASWKDVEDPAADTDAVEGGSYDDAADGP